MKAKRRVVGAVSLMGNLITILETGIDKELDVTGVGAVNGYYDPDHKVIVIDSRLPPNAKDAVLEHELGHALLNRIGFSERLEQTMSPAQAHETEEMLVDKVMPAFVELWSAVDALKFTGRK